MKQTRVLRIWSLWFGIAAIGGGILASGCAHKVKPSSRIYEGDAPSIHYSKRESAGGPIGGR